MPSHFVLKPKEANLIHDTDWFSKMNPYCTFIVGNQRIKNQVCKKGGKHPHWTDSVTIPVGAESELTVEVMDRDTITPDDKIGSFSVNLREIESSGSLTRWYPLFHRNKLAGEILMESVFRGDPSRLIDSTTNVIPGTQTLLAEQQMLNTNVETVQVPRPLGETNSGVLQESMKISQAPVLIEENVKLTQVTDTNLSQKANMQLSQEEHMRISGGTGMNLSQETGMRFSQPGHEHVFVETRQSVEPHTFQKDVDVIETRNVVKEIEVLEAHKVLKDVQYTEAVHVKKQIEMIEPRVVTKEVEVIEPRLITKQIQVIENVPVMKQVEVIESVPVMQEIDTVEPQTFTKQIEVTEQVPVRKQMTVTEPVHVKKSVEFVEPIITTQTITKEMQPSVIVDERVTTEVGPASLIGVETKQRISQEYGESYIADTKWNKEQNLSLSEKKRLEKERLAREGVTTSWQKEPLREQQNWTSEQQRLAQEGVTTSWQKEPVIETYEKTTKTKVSSGLGSENLSQKKKTDVFEQNY